MAQETPFKGISYLELWRPFCLVQRNCLCNIGRKHYDECFSEDILNLNQWYTVLIYFLSRALATFLFGREEPFVQFW